MTQSDTSKQGWGGDSESIYEMIEEHLNTSQDQITEIKNIDEKILLAEKAEKNGSCLERIKCNRRQSETEDDEDEENE